MYKYELHAHTAECDLAARVGARDMVRLYKEAGYDGIVITDHYFQTFFDWFGEELKDATHEQVVTRWLRGYREAKAEGERIGFTVLPGAEARMRDNINDYLIYGLHEEFFFGAPRLNDLESVDDLLKVLPETACVVHAHPFRDNMTVKTPRGLFGIEVYNSGTNAFRNDLARQFAEFYGLAMTSGSDIHGLDRLGKGGIMTERKIATPEDLVAVLKSGEYELIKSL